MTSTSANGASREGAARQDFGSADQNKPAENNRPTTATQAALINTIKAHISAGDKAQDKAQQHYIAAGQHLKTLKASHTDTWAEWETLLKEKIGIGKSRASELMQIADGTRTAAEVAAATTERGQRHRALSPLRNGEKAKLSVDDGERRRRGGAEADGEVEKPEVVTQNFLDTVSRHTAVLKAYKKVFAMSVLTQAQKEEVRTAIRGLISKWQSLGRALAPDGDAP
jgi:hypothetical protein